MSDAAQQPPPRLWHRVLAVANTARRIALRILRPVGRLLTHPIRIKGRQWNPLRTDAFFYGRRNPRFWHGTTFGLLFNLLLLLILTLPLHLIGCREEYILPEGGGTLAVQAVRPIVVQRKKIKKRKLVVSKHSPIKFGIPDIDEMVREKVTEFMVEATRERYRAGTTETGRLGMGEGAEAGYGFGGRGAIRFIRLQYDGGDWDQDMGRGADYNLLLEHKIRTGQKVHKETEHRTIAELDNFEKFKSPPFVYITGQRDIRLSEDEIRMLRRYLLEKHGMLFADNGGSAAWGQRFKAVMRRVLPEIKPVPIPSDDELYRRPYIIPSLPYVSPHDPPMVATGWKYQGRWVAYYHPGDLGDAWKDGHSGVSRQVADASYALGINIIAYACQKYGEWFIEMRGKVAKQK